MDEKIKGVVLAFVRGKPRKVGSDYTDGTGLFHGVESIAKKIDGYLFIKHPARSDSPKEVVALLNFIPQINLEFKKEKYYLDGNIWEAGDVWRPIKICKAKFRVPPLKYEKA